MHETREVEIPSHLNYKDVMLLAEITHARVSQMQKEGIIKRDSTGEFPLVKTVKALIMYYKNMNTGSAVNRYKAAKADLAEMKAKEAKKLLLRREEVEFGIGKMLSIITEKLNDMPEVLAGLVAGKDIEDCAETIRNYVAEALGAMRSNIKAEFGAK